MIVVQQYSRILFLTLLYVFLCFPQITKSIQFTLINGEGMIKPSPTLKQYLMPNKNSNEAKYDSIIAILDCTSSVGDPSCVNELLQTNFQNMPNGI